MHMYIYIYIYICICAYVVAHLKSTRVGLKLHSCSTDDHVQCKPREYAHTALSLHANTHTHIYTVSETHTYMYTVHLNHRAGCAM